MKNSIVSGMLGVALGLAACGEDGHEVDVELDASRDEARGDAGARDVASDAPVDVGGSAFTDLIDLIGTVLGTGGDAPIDVNAFCGLLGTCPSGMDVADSGRDEMRDAGPRGPRRDAGSDGDASTDASTSDASVADAGAEDAEASDAAPADAQAASDAQVADGAPEDASEAAVPDAGDAASDGEAASDGDVADAAEPDAASPPAT